MICLPQSGPLGSLEQASRVGGLLAKALGPGLGPGRGLGPGPGPGPEMPETTRTEVPKTAAAAPVEPDWAQ